MLFRFFFRQIADSWVLIGLSMAMMGVSLVGIFQRSQPLVSLLLAAGSSSSQQQRQQLPDARFSGYTVHELNTYYDILGMDGCRMYIAVENWDIFPFMVSYTLCLGSVLTILARKLYPSHPRRGDSLSLLAMIIWMLDMIETVIQRQGCRIYPDRLPDPHILLASAAVQLKWKLFMLSVGIIVIGSIRVLIVWQGINPDSNTSTTTTTTRTKNQ
jgi:hypothetical protein